MNPTARISTAERLGHRIGRGLRAYVRGERRVLTWLAPKRMPVPAATALLWIVKLTALGVLFYVAFWFALVLLAAGVAGWAMAQQQSAEDGFELQYPTIEELRATPGYDPNLYNDTSHEMYHDD
ncbi:DUF3742 family protein [Variovorax paradoxus]|jgi:Protein of unknown function (DUF3742)|uniref:DUF3742 family protein n=1 Tax=Variovorax paradoxus TaxID=34073 RepID=A0A0H2MNR5_VARPD|nr:DUF3742 family protein [Variovorax paradoxus]KLN58340.1 hypothetical protein VPARA_04550 [Variovorax paradoxus]